MAEANKSLDIFDEVDEIDNLTKQNRQTKQKIKQLKEWTIKNMVYTNVDIPSNWQQKQGYRELMFSTMNKDKAFLNYLSQQNCVKEEMNENAKNKKRKSVKEEDDLPNIDEKNVNDRKKTNVSSNMMKSTGSFNIQSGHSTSTNFFQPAKTATAGIFRKPTGFGNCGIDNLERLAMKKRLESKTFYKTDTMAKARSTSTTTKKQPTKSKSEYGPFLNINSNTEKK